VQPTVLVVDAVQEEVAAMTVANLKVAAVEAVAMKRLQVQVVAAAKILS
jgi:hypothetical protein